MERVLHCSEPKGDDQLINVCSGRAVNTYKSHISCALNDGTSSYLDNINMKIPILSSLLFSDGDKNNDGNYGANEHLLNLARVSEICALKKLENCQQELIQVQKMWDEDREARRWTIATLQQEVNELQKQLKHQRYCNVSQCTHLTETMSTTSSYSFSSVVPSQKYLTLSASLNVDGSVSQGSINFNEACGQSEGKTSETRSSKEEKSHFLPESFFSTLSSSGAGCTLKQRPDGFLAYVYMLEDNVERYRRLLWDADNRCDELRAELSRAVQEKHDIRRMLTERISRLLFEREAIAHSHAVALQKLKSTTELFIAARAAERAAVQQLVSDHDGDEVVVAADKKNRTASTRTTTTTAVSLAATTAETNTNEARCSQCSCSSSAAAATTVAVNNNNNDGGGGGGVISSGLTALPQGFIEEMCALDYFGARGGDDVESLRRIFLRFLEEIEGSTYQCGSLTLETITCLREIMSLLAEDEDESESESDGGDVEYNNNNNDDDDDDDDDDGSEWEKIKNRIDERDMKRNFRNDENVLFTQLQKTEQKQKKKREKNDEGSCSVTECTPLPLPLQPLSSSMLSSLSPSLPMLSSSSSMLYSPVDSH